MTPEAQSNPRQHRLSAHRAERPISTVGYVLTLALAMTLLFAWGSAQAQEISTADESLSAWWMRGWEGEAPANYAEKVAANASIRNGSGSILNPTPEEMVAQWTRMVFQSFWDGNWEIYTAKGDGTDLVRVTYHGASDIRPKLNHDGSKIVFVSDRDGDWEIYTMNVDGSDLRKLTNNDISDTMPAWSPDGNQLVYAQEESGRYRIYMMNADGSGKHAMYDNGHSQVHPSWSPDGQYLAWVEVIDRKTGGLQIGRSDGTYNRQLLTATYLQYPAWSPSGAQIAYDAANEFGWNRIRSYVLATGEITFFFFDDYPPNAYDHYTGSWGPQSDLSRMVFTEARYRIVEGQYLFNGFYIYQYPHPTQPGTKLILGSGLDGYPDRKQIDFAPPTSQVNPLPAYSNAEDLDIYWGGSDSGPAGIAAYDVQVQVGTQGQWTDWMMDTTALYWRYPGIPGTVVAFRSRARDYANNVEDWPDVPDAVTTFYTYRLAGQVTDNRGLPLLGPTLAISPQTVAPTTIDRMGRYDTLLTSYEQNLISLEAPGYQSRLGEVAYRHNDSFLNLYLTPNGYLSTVKNGDFESASSTPWLPGGDVPGRIVNKTDYLDTAQGELHAYCSPAPCSATPQNPSTSELSQVVTVPAEHRPTLAFMSSIVSLGRDSSLEVWVTEGITRTTALVVSTPSSDWKLRWVDMTPWAGRQVTVTFAAVHRDPSTSFFSNSYVHIDHVTLAPWLTPIAEQVTPSIADLDVTTPITVTGQNFLDGATVQLRMGAQTVIPTAVTWVDTETLIADLPALGPGLYDLWVTNPGGQQSVRIGAIKVGKQSYLPSVAR